MEKNKLQHHNITTDTLFDDIRNIIEQGRRQAYAAANQITVLTYWHIGRRIVEEEQHGEARAQYGTRLIKTLAEQLMPKYGNTFSKRNLDYFRQFYLCFNDLEIVNTRVHNLTWSHFRSIIQVADPKAREWYVKEASEQMWSVRTLNRNIGTQYYGRRMACVREGLALPSPDIEANDPLEYIKSPVVAEFLGFRKDSKYDESQLEQALIDHLQQFIMELGRGFAFVDRQKHISTDTGDFYIDLVFYNIKLKRYVLFELKTHPLTHADVGQLDMYVRMYDDLVKDEIQKENETVKNFDEISNPSGTDSTEDGYLISDVSLLIHPMAVSLSGSVVSEEQTETAEAETADEGEHELLAAAEQKSNLSAGEMTASAADDVSTLRAAGTILVGPDNYGTNKTSTPTPTATPSKSSSNNSSSNSNTGSTKIPQKKTQTTASIRSIPVNTGDETMVLPLAISSALSAAVMFCMAFLQMQAKRAKSMAAWLEFKKNHPFDEK